jgi:hypothetical protein
MQNLFKIVRVGIVLIVVAYAVVVSGLSLHDRRTIDRLTQSVLQEVKPGASLDTMDTYLRRHTTRYALDREYHSTFGGFIPQTKWDRFWFNRQVQISFLLNKDGTMRDVEVSVFYTTI